MQRVPVPPRAWICRDDSARHLDRYQALAERLLIGDRAPDVEPLTRREPVASLLRGAASRLHQLGIDPMQADVEALLVNRARGDRRYWLVPIDDCYRLVGVIRTRWKGLSGGNEVWTEIDRFFDELDERSRPATREAARNQTTVTASAAGGGEEE